MGALRNLASDVVLDCEFAVPDERGHPDFDAVRCRSLIQRALIDRAALETPATLSAFDLLACDDRDFRSLPVVERKAHQYRSVQDGASIRAVRCLDAHGEAMFTQAFALDLEGMSPGLRHPSCLPLTSAMFARRRHRPAGAPSVV